MSLPTNRKVLVLGLGSGVDPDTQANWSAQQVSEAIQREFEKTRKAGFHPERYAVDLGKPESVILDELRVVLKKNQWDGVSIGFGIRGAEENTALFEEIVNMVTEEVHPTPKFIFSLRPNRVWEAISRVFGVDQGI